MTGGKYADKLYKSGRMRHKICGIDGKKAEASVYWYGAFAAGAAQGVYRGGRTDSGVKQRG